MLRVLFTKELRENVQNSRFFITLIVCCTVIPTGFYAHYRQYEVKKSLFEQSVRTYEESHQTVQEVMQRGAEVFRPPSSLSMLSSGIEQLLPTSVESVGFLRYTGANTQFLNNRSLDTPYGLLYGSLDLATIVVMIMSVLAILFSFNSISGEKETGSLALVLSHAVPRHLILLSKTAAHTLTLLTVFSVGVLLGLLLLIAMGFEILSGSTLLIHFIIGVGVSYLYIIVIMLLGMMISSLSKSSILSIVVLLSCWVFLFMIFPRCSVIAAKLIRPVASQQVIDLEKSQRRIQHDSAVEEQIDELLASTPDLKDQSISEFRRNLQASGEQAVTYVEQVHQIQARQSALLHADLERIEAFYATQKRSQVSLAKSIARVSPVSCFIHLLSEISHNGLLEDAQWQQTRLDFRRVLEEEICRYHEPSVRFKNFSSSNFSGERGAPAPRFASSAVSLQTIAENTWIDLVVLVLYALFFFITAHVLFLRYDVR